MHTSNQVDKMTAYMSALCLESLSALWGMHSISPTPRQYLIASISTWLAVFAFSRRLRLRKLTGMAHFAVMAAYFLRRDAACEHYPRHFITSATLRPHFLPTTNAPAPQTLHSIEADRFAKRPVKAINKLHVTSRNKLDRYIRVQNAEDQIGFIKKQSEHTFSTRLALDRCFRTRIFPRITSFTLNTGFFVWRHVACDTTIAVKKLEY